MKFDHAKIPPTHELVGVAPLSGIELDTLKNLYGIREGALERLREIEKQAFALGRQFHQADQVFDGELIKIAWRLHWDEVSVTIFDETEDKLYGLKVKPEAMPTSYGPPKS